MSGQKQRFSVDGTEKFEQLIQKQLSEIKDRVMPFVKNGMITSIILGGGYGRGEGGVLKTELEELPFNDYDFFVITPSISAGKKKELSDQLFEIGEELTESYGIDVDFGPPVSINKIPNMPPTQMWMELKKAYYTLVGRDGVLDAYPWDDFSEMPLDETMKLLLNRGVGLYLAKKELDGGGSSSDKKSAFILRNLHKASIAIGDAILMVEKKLHHSYQKRLTLLLDLPDRVASQNVKELYRAAIEYKLTPTLWFDNEKMNSMIDNISSEFKGIYLDVVSAYSDEDYHDFQSFYSSYIPQNSDATVKNMLLNIKYFSLKSMLFWGRFYPRERLYFTLPEILFHNAENQREKIYNTLDCSDYSDYSGFASKFLAIWRRFN